MSLGVTIWVTNSCNMDCTYCYEGANKKDSMMSMEVADATVAYITQLLQNRKEKQCNIHFHGGEPLLNQKVIWHIKRKLDANESIKFIYSLTTNALIVHELYFNELLKIDDLSVSIDGDQISHDKYRVDMGQKGTFNRVLANSKKILSYKPDVSVRMTIKPDTVDQLYHNIMFLIKEGFHKIRLSLDYYDEQWTEAAFVMMHDQLGRIHKEYGSQKEISVSLISNPYLSKKGKCMGGISSFQITSTGDLYPCLAVVDDKDFRCGDIYHGVSDDRTQRMNDINDVTIAECEGCGLSEYCITSRCRLVNYSITGRCDHASPVVCAFQNLAYQLRKQILNEEVHEREYT